MHGRTIALAGALTTLALAATPAAGARAITPGQAADADGVVVSWKVQTATPQTVRLRTIQPTTGPTLTTAESDPVSLSATQAIAARLPIAAGGRIELEGETGSPTVTAEVEPDTDGDAYGDTTQDACPGDYADHAAPCDATATLGSPLTLAPDGAYLAGGTLGVEALQQAAPGATAAAPATSAGVLTHWRFRAWAGFPAGDTVLQLLRPAASGDGYVVAAETATVHVTSTAVVDLPAQLAVRPGDRLAARSVPRGGDAYLGAFARRVGDAVAFTGAPPATAGQVFTPDATTPDLRLLVQADVEPDLDGDGRGDVSQDHADVALTGSAPAAVGTQDTLSHTYTIINRGPDTAAGLRLTIRGAAGVTPDTPAGATCAGNRALGTATCTLAALAPDASIAVVQPIVGAAIGTVTTTATVTAGTGDPDTFNNSATLSTDVHGYAPSIPAPQPFRIVVCGNVIRGTRDDDALRGTVFGDRLVGNDGDDLLKGNGGDDCLEGGSGSDVLDGGDGNDRLAGSSGADRLTGGAGADRLTGGKGNDTLSGGPGNDLLSPGDGKDAIAAGSGNDTVNAVDGVRETVDCGAGRDTVRADKRDRLAHCEKVTRR
ncbi:calcium-binding protein [Baekduia alba]|uniref:calcium-binding protein n=1 Tax=Baekduia alba TaxID=2997333 RepID=UPI0023410F26|nr:calcium-binding protein [Baekduia alba]